MINKSYKRCLTVLNAGWVTVAFTVAIGGVIFHPQAVGADWLLFSVLAAFAYFSNNMKFQVALANNYVSFSASSAPIIIAAIYMSPIAAMLMCILLTYDWQE